MVIISDRSKLDEALKNENFTILVLANGEKTSAVHKWLEEHRSNFELWQEWFLILNINILRQEEISEWFDRNTSEYYAVLCGRTENVFKKGKIDDLLRTDGNPGMMKIREAFLSGSNQ